MSKQHTGKIFELVIGSDIWLKILRGYKKSNALLCRDFQNIPETQHQLSWASG
jgi:hypothetical protein